MKKIILSVLLLVVVGGLCAIMLTNDQPSVNEPDDSDQSIVKLFENALSEKNVVLIESQALTTKTGCALVTRSYSSDQLSKQPLYLKNPASDEAFICFAGPAHSLPSGPNIRTVESSLLVTCSDDLILCLVDGTPLKEDVARWSAYWISPAGLTAAPNAAESLTETVIAKDGFMRKVLENDSWKVTEGTWRMKQHGGGMAVDDEQLKSYNFQRAVNPFSVTGHGILSYGDKDCAHSRGTASFYFGKPWKVGAVDKKTLPKGLILMAFGDPAGSLIGFGWDGRVRKFGILERSQPGAKWTMIEERAGPRPARSNWVTIGLQVRNGLVLEGILDGTVVIDRTLGHTAKGSFQVVCSELTEFDDFAIAPITPAESVGNPVYIRSKQFAGKQEKNRSDPEEFGKWARGESAFIKTVADTADDRWKKAVLLSRWPMMGDFYYESVLEGSDANGKPLSLPYGVYQFEILSNPRDGIPIYTTMSPLFSARLTYDETGWSSENESLALTGESILKLRRNEKNGNVIEVERKGGYVPVSYRVDGPVHVAVCRIQPHSSIMVHPKPDNHAIRSKNLVNELFESTPANWSWVDGGFRMDCRWACQNQWNFMACGSKDVSMLVSKRQFHGNQEHEYFMSLRPMLPSDAGDPSFTFSTALHRNLLQRFGGWYVRRDLCFSFCMDGKNPMSGYTFIFGGKENTETLLLRNGKVVASTREALFPRSTKVLDVHWEWWAFAVRKYGGRIIVLYKDKPIFDYSDPDPLTGGHLAFWTVRNGFTLSKVVSTAERIAWKPDVLYVNEDCETPWTPIVPDAVTLTPANDDCVRVTANVGGGSAIRYNFVPPVIIKRTPVMTLPLRVPDGVKVNLHLHIDNKAKLVQVNAPLTHTKALLTPEFEPDYNFWIRDRREMLEEMERNEFFQIPVIPESTIKLQRLLASVVPDDSGKITIDLTGVLGEQPVTFLRSITIGNASNENYMLVGNGANAAGSSFIVGKPTFQPAESP